MTLFKKLKLLTKASEFIRGMAQAHLVENLLEPEIIVPWAPNIKTTMVF